MTLNMMDTAMHIMTEVFNVAHQQRFELLRDSEVSLQQHGFLLMAKNLC